jgi:uncharacterized membrane protein YidH (DUF202 family)/DNA-directed RNA polymerase subunit RPC12/RpoP
MIRFACPGCSATFTVADEKAGKTGKCPKCQSQFVIPAAEASASADAPPPLPPPPAPAPSSRAPSPPPPPADPNEPVEIQPCPKCSTRLSVLPTDVGLDIQCPSCETVFKALRADAPPPPESGAKKGSSSLVKLGSGSDKDDDDDDRGSKRKSKRRDDDDDDDDRPSRRRSSRRDDDDDDDDRPSSRRRSKRDDDDEERSSKRRSRRDDDADDRPSRRDHDDYDDDNTRPSRRRSRRFDDDSDYGRSNRPSQVQTLAIFLLIGGIGACVLALLESVTSAGYCCLWPGTYYGLVYGIMAIIRGSQMMGRHESRQSPRTMFIMAIVCIVNLDILNLVFGILGMSMLNSPELQRYYRT